MASITVTKVTKNADGSVSFQFGKTERTFESVAAAVAFARDVLANQAAIQAAAIALMLTRQPSLNNPSVFEGHSVAVDFSLNNWGTIT